MTSYRYKTAVLLITTHSNERRVLDMDGRLLSITEKAHGVMAGAHDGVKRQNSEHVCRVFLTPFWLCILMGLHVLYQLNIAGRKSSVICLGTEEEPEMTKINVNLQLRIWIGQLTRACICCSDALVVDPT